MGEKLPSVAVADCINMRDVRPHIVVDCDSLRGKVNARLLKTEARKTGATPRCYQRQCGFCAAFIALSVFEKHLSPCNPPHFARQVEVDSAPFHLLSYAFGNVVVKGIEALF